MKIIISILALLGVFAIQAQNYLESKETVDGKYFLLKPEKAVEGFTKVKYLELKELNGVKKLKVAICKEDCFYVSYAFKPELTQKSNKSIFYSASDVFAMKYDQESFVLFKVNPKNPYVNFYSRSKEKVDQMTESKAFNFALQTISKF